MIPCGSGTPRTTSNVGNQLGYTGSHHDVETGLVYMRSRYYNPATGRFLTKDPIGTCGDLTNVGNSYAFVG